MTKRFYVASNKMSNGIADERGWLRTYSEAVEEAKERLNTVKNSDGRPLNAVYVVEVVAIIEREETPIRVVEVRK